MVDSSAASFQKGMSVLFAFMLLSFVLLSGCATTDDSKDDDRTQIAKASIDLADEYFDRGMYDEALGVYDRALDEVDDHRLLYNKALVLIRMERFDDALAVLEKGTVDFPHVLLFRTTQAQLYSRQGNTDAAREIYIEVLAMNPYDVGTRKEFIALLVEDGDLDAAHEQALILWNQGYRTKENLGLLQ